MHIRISILLKIFVALVVALLITGYAILRSQDFNDFKPLIAEQVERLTGRKLVIEGALDLRISFTPSLAVRGVRLANADWGSRPNMMSVEVLAARVALLPLLAGKIDVEQVLLSGVDILLETDAEGQANYQFSSSNQSASTGASSEDDLVVPVIRDMRISDAALTYRDGVSGRQLQLRLDELTVFGQGPNQPLELRLAAAFNDTPLSVQATLGSPAEMLAPSKPWPLDVIVESADSTLTLAGTVAEPAAGKGLDLRFEAKGSEFAGLSRLADIELPQLGSFRVAARILGDALGQISLQELDARLGDARSFAVEATGAVGSVTELQGFDLDFEIQGSDLSPLAALVSTELPVLRPFSITVSAEGNLQRLTLTELNARVGESQLAGRIELSTEGVRPHVGGFLASQRIDLADLPLAATTADAVVSDRVFPDTPLPVDAMRLFDAELTLRVDALAAKGMQIENLSAALELQDGDFVARDIAFQFSGGTVTAAARVDAGGSTRPWQLNSRHVVSILVVWYETLAVRICLMLTSVSMPMRQDGVVACAGSWLI